MNNEKCLSCEKSAIGKRVRVISKSSYRHYKKFGRVVGLSKSGEYIEVYFDDTKCKARFKRESVEFVN